MYDETFAYSIVWGWALGREMKEQYKKEDWNTERTKNYDDNKFYFFHFLSLFL